MGRQLGRAQLSAAAMGVLLELLAGAASARWSRLADRPVALWLAESDEDMVVRSEIGSLTIERPRAPSSVGPASSSRRRCERRGPRRGAVCCSAPRSVAASLDPELHRAVRRHEEEIARLFRNYLGYRLSTDSHTARLYKAGLGPRTGRPFLRRDRTPFTPRDYTYLVLVCSVLLTTRSQVLLSAVASEVRQAASEAGIELGADNLPQRRALVHALRKLIEWGAVTEDAGSVTDYADDPTREALLWVERDLIRGLLAVALRDLDDPAELVRNASDVEAESVRRAVRRKIVENPVVMLADLTEPEAAWLRQSQRREAQILEESFGLELEIRAEGVAAFDPWDELSDVRFPREGTLGQASLLALAELVGRIGAPGPAIRGDRAAGNARVRRRRTPRRALGPLVEGLHGGPGSARRRRQGFAHLDGTSRRHRPGRARPARRSPAGTHRSRRSGPATALTLEDA